MTDEEIRVLQRPPKRPPFYNYDRVDLERLGALVVAVMETSYRYEVRARWLRERGEYQVVVWIRKHKRLCTCGGCPVAKQAIGRSATSLLVAFDSACQQIRATAPVPPGPSKGARP